MSTSAAMTIPPGTDEHGPGTQTSKALSTTDVPVQYSQLQDSVQLPPQQLGAAISLPQSENNITMLPRAHVGSANQQPINWIPAPHFMQQAPMQDHLPTLPDHSRLPSSEAPAFDYTFPCLHHPSQRCNCTHMPPPSRRLQHGHLTPNDWNSQQPHLQHLVPQIHHMQPSSSGELAYRDDCEHHGSGQLCACRFFPPHSHWTKDGYVAVAPRAMDMRYNDFGVEMHPENTAGFMQHY